MAADLISETARTMLIAAATGLFAGGSMWKFMGDRLAAHQTREVERFKTTEDLNKFLVETLRKENETLRGRVEQLEAAVERLRSLEFEVQRLQPFERRVGELQALLDGMRGAT